MSLFGKATLLMFTLVCGVALLAQDESPCLRRTLYVSVTDKEFRPLAGLGDSNFRAKLRGKPVQILSVEKSPPPRRVVVVLDASGSMIEPGPRFATIKTFAVALLDYIPASTQTALIIFSDKVEEKLGFDHSRQEMAQVISLLGSKEHPIRGRRTALFDAIGEASAMLSNPGPEDLIYVVSDGGDNRSKTEVGRLKLTLLSEGIRLYGILPLELSPPTPEEQEGPSQLGGIADETGGITFPYYGSREQSKAELENRLNLVKGLLAQTADSYRLEIRLPEIPAKKQSWKLETVGLPPIRGGVRLSYPRDLLPCANLGSKN